VGSALTGLGWLALDAGQTADAEQWLDKATSALDQAGPWFMLLVEFLRATLAVRRGEADQAIPIVRTSLARIRLLRDQFAFLCALEPLAAAAALKGKDAWVSRILGARAGVAGLTDAAVVGQYLRDRLAAIELDCKTRLGIERWEDAFTAGRTTSIDALCNDIDLEDRLADGVRFRSWCEEVENQTNLVGGPAPLLIVSPLRAEEPTVES